MNISQRKILVVGLFVFSPILFLVGVMKENVFVALILPFVSIFAALFFRSGSLGYKQITYEQYADVLCPRIVNSLLDATAKETDNYFAKRNAPTEGGIKDVREFYFDKFDIDTFKNQFIEVMKKNYTHEEFQYLATYNLSEIGLRIFDKSEIPQNELREILSLHITKVYDLMDEKFK
jgi:hypothetical protein